MNSNLPSELISKEFFGKAGIILHYNYDRIDRITCFAFVRRFFSLTAIVVAGTTATCL